MSLLFFSFETIVLKRNFILKFLSPVLWKMSLIKMLWQIHNSGLQNMLAAFKRDIMPAFTICSQRRLQNLAFCYIGRNLCHYEPAQTIKQENNFYFFINVTLLFVIPPQNFCKPLNCWRHYVMLTHSKKTPKKNKNKTTTKQAILNINVLMVPA